MFRDQRILSAIGGFLLLLKKSTVECKNLNIFKHNLNIFKSYMHMVKIAN